MSAESDPRPSRVYDNSTSVAYPGVVHTTDTTISEHSSQTKNAKINISSSHERQATPILEKTTFEGLQIVRKTLIGERWITYCNQHLINPISALITQGCDFFI